MEILKWLNSSSGMSAIALMCSFLVLGSTYLSSNFKDREIKDEKKKHQRELNNKQEEIIALQNRIITEIKAPYFELKPGKLLPNGKLQINVKNISSVHIRSLILLVSAQYAIKDEDNPKTTPYLKELDITKFKINAKDSFTTLDPSKERIIEVNLFPDGELNKLEKQFGRNATILYTLNVSPNVDAYSVLRDESMANNGIPHIGVGATIGNFKTGSNYKTTIKIGRPELSYNPQGEIPRDSLTVISTNR